MSSAARYTPHYTVEDYRRWEGDWELWSGTAVAMTPSPFGRHGGMLARLVSALTNSIDAVGCNASVLVEVDWIISEDTVVRPDASVICGQPPDGHIESSPAMVVEVLSAATRQRDINHKRALYCENGVPWYLIADPIDSSIQLLRLGEKNKYVSIPVGEKADVKVCEDCQLEVNLGWRFG